MNAVDKAKARVAKVFDALAHTNEAKWSELVRGGWEAKAPMLNGSLEATVGTTGEYDVSIRRGNLHINILSGGYCSDSLSEQAESEQAESGQMMAVGFAGESHEKDAEHYALGGTSPAPNIDRGNRWG